MCRAPFHTCVECNDCVIFGNSHTKWPHINTQFSVLALTPSRPPSAPKRGNFTCILFTHKNAITNACAHLSTLNTTEIMTDEIYLFAFLWFYYSLNDDIRLEQILKRSVFFGRRTIYEHSQLYVYYTIKIIGHCNKNKKTIVFLFLGEAERPKGKIGSNISKWVCFKECAHPSSTITYKRTSTTCDTHLVFLFNSAVQINVQRLLNKLEEHQLCVDLLWN